MNDLNSVTLIGRVVKDFENKQAGSSNVAKSSIAVNESFGLGTNKKESVNYFDVCAWGKGGDVLTQYATKGKRIAVTGKLKQNLWNDKDGNKRSSVFINIETFQFLDSANKTEKSEVSNQIEDAFSGETFASSAFDDSGINLDGSKRICLSDYLSL